MGCPLDPALSARKAISKSPGKRCPGEQNHISNRKPGHIHGRQENGRSLIYKADFNSQIEAARNEYVRARDYCPVNRASPPGNPSRHEASGCDGCKIRKAKSKQSGDPGHSNKNSKTDGN